MTTYDIHLEGVHASDLSMTVLRDVAHLISEGAARATRLAVEGRSSARGSAPSWLVPAAEVRMTSLQEGSLSLELQARPLAETGPDLFAQQLLFGQRNADATSMDLFMEAVDDALAGRRDSERLDAGILRLLVDTQNLFGRGPTRLTLTRRGGRCVAFGGSDVKDFQKFADATPESRVERVVGVLDSLTISTRTFILRVDEKTPLRGLAGSVSLDVLKGLLGARVVVEGTVAFRASGRPQRIEVDYAALAVDHDDIWQRLPQAEVGSIPIGAGGSDLGSLFGEWPGSENDEEVFAALDDLS